MSTTSRGSAAAAAAADASPRRRARAHACFRLEALLPIGLPAEREAHELWHALSYRVMREPADLLAHTRRVLLCTRGDLAAKLPGALEDLNRATGRGRALALRRRLLRASAARLGAREAAFFERALAETEAATAAPGSPSGGVDARVSHLPEDAPTFAGSVLPTMARLHRLPPTARRV